LLAQASACASTILTKIQFNQYFHTWKIFCTNTFSYSTSGRSYHCKRIKLVTNQQRHLGTQGGRKQVIVYYVGRKNSPNCLFFQSQNSI